MSPGKPIDETARELGLDPSQIVKVASNENPLGPSPLAKAAMREALEEAHIYPDGGGYRLRTAIAESLGSTAGTWCSATAPTKSSSCSATPSSTARPS
jgi:histidinol-phosphate/aromatic aminotransferase/cobyric acid decarboxylase-like protein